MDKTRRRNGNGKDLTPSGRPSQSELALLMADTQRRYPNQPLTREQADAYMDDWSELVRRYGMPRFNAALRECWITCQFFPMTANIKGLMPEELPATEETAMEKAERWRKDLEARGEPGLGMADLAADPRVKELMERFKHRQSNAGMGQ